ncbi:hypothetical protein WN944_007163 [Citrus x changshan-huyou]|uniref:Uncharacterized protein n=1 Tax=Citrus x changshan-huyou TaxID=2935761 RepID=A0AAP0QU51_9ROSI
MATTTVTGWLISDSGGWNVCISESETDGEGELAMKPMTTKVPPRYVRPDIKDVMICNNNNSSTEQLPVIVKVMVGRFGTINIFQNGHPN